MIITLKQLKKSGEVFAPQTVAEAVLVKDGEEISRLDTVLEKKIEAIVTPAGSGVFAYPQGKSVIITHSNTITATESPAPVQVQYDNRGHIISAIPFGKTVVSVNGGTVYAVLDGTEDKQLSFGDDFDVDENNNIKLKWNNI